MSGLLLFLQLSQERSFAQEVNGTAIIIMEKNPLIIMLIGYY